MSPVYHLQTPLWCRPGGDIEYSEEIPLFQESHKKGASRRGGALRNLGAALFTAEQKKQEYEGVVTLRSYLFSFAILLILAHGYGLFESLVGSSSAETQELVLLSGHLGPKFMGLGQVFASNKKQFAVKSNASLFLAEDVLSDPGFREFLPEGVLDYNLASHSNEVKMWLTLAIFAKYGEQVKWAVWLDGDTWLVAHAVDLVAKLRLTADRPEDLIIGTETPDLNTTLGLPPCLGINAGVFAIRNSASGIAMLRQLLAISPATYAEPQQNFNDQCALQELWKMDPASRSRTAVLDSKSTGRHLQCRARAKCAKYFSDLCCTEDSWSIHWPASGWHDLLERVIEEKTGTAVLTNLAHSVEVEACRAMQAFAGHRVPVCDMVTDVDK